MASVMSLIATRSFMINEVVVDMRENPTHDSKVVSQTIFSENVKVEQEIEGWSYIITPDGYSGWIELDSLVSLSEPYDPTLKISRLSAHVYGVKDTEYGPIKTLPYGAKLQVIDSSDLRWFTIALPDGQEGYVQKGDVEVEPELLYKSDLVEFSQKFQGLPYTWGGRSSFGYDCSGFVQMLYHQIGIDLQRDSKQQILDNRFQSLEIEALEPGDLIFFGKTEHRIMHVGMFLGKGEFIHSTSRENKPWIRISNLSDFEWKGDPNAFYPYRTCRQLIKK
jgi:gamma-D-glutamyl-L-lysine dipeptidyl-peptidase